MDAGVDTAEERPDGWEPAALEVGQGKSRVFHYRSRYAGMELCPVKSNLKEGAELGARTNVFEQLKSASDALFVVQKSIANTKVASRAKDNGARCVLVVATLGKAGRGHLLLDVVQLRLCHVAAGKAVGHARKPHHPVGCSGLVE